MNLKKTIEYLFYLIVFLLPWRGVWIWREVFVGGFKWEYGTVGLYGVDVFVMLLFTLILLDKLFIQDTRYKIQDTKNIQYPISNNQSIFNSLISKLKNWNFIQNSKFKIQNYVYVLRLTSYALIAWSFLSIAWSPDKILALYFSFKIFLAVGLFWIVMKIKLDWRKLMAVLLLAGALQGGLAMGQFLMQKDFSSTLLGTSEHLASRGGSSVIETESGRWLRAYGTFAHPNILGGYLAVVLLIIIRQDTRYKKQDTKKSQISNLKSQKKSVSKCSMLHALCSMIIFSGLIVSFSRSAWMVFVIGFILLFIFQKEKRRELGKLVFVFFAVALVWLSAFSPLFFSRTAGQGRLEQKSFDDRSEYVLQAKEIIGNNFWLGVGAGNYTKYLYDPLPTSPLEKGRGMTPIWQIQPVHNVFLLVWSELGFVGLMLFIIFLFLLLKIPDIFRKKFWDDKKFFLFLVPCSLFLVNDHWLWTSHFGLIFLFFISALSLVESNEKTYN